MYYDPSVDILEPAPRSRTFLHRNVSAYLIIGLLLIPCLQYPRAVAAEADKVEFVMEKEIPGGFLFRIKNTKENTVSISAAFGSLNGLRFKPSGEYQLFKKSVQVDKGSLTSVPFVEDYPLAPGDAVRFVVPSVSLLDSKADSAMLRLHDGLESNRFPISLAKLSDVELRFVSQDSAGAMLFRLKNKGEHCYLLESAGETGETIFRAAKLKWEVLENNKWRVLESEGKQVPQDDGARQNFVLNGEEIICFKVRAKLPLGKTLRLEIDTVVSDEFTISK